MKRTLKLVAFLLVVISATSGVRSQGWAPPAGSPVANREHPRIWVTNSSLPGLRAKMVAGGLLHDDAKTWQAWLDSNYTRAWSPNEQPYAVAHYAFAYLLVKNGPLGGLSFSHSPAEYAQKARDLLFGYVSATGGNMSFDAESMIAASDWIQPTLSASDRRDVVKWYKTSSRMTDDGNPFVTTQVSARSNKILAGLACVGDGIDDAWCVEQAGMYQALFRDTTGVTRSESDLVGDDGGAGQGISYGFGHTMRRALFAEEGYRTATGASLMSHYGGADARFFRTQPQHFAYRVLPWAPAAANFPGGRQYRFEKGYYMNAGAGVQEHEYAAWLNAVGGLYETIDPKITELAAWLIANRTGEMEGHFSILQDWVFSKFIVGPAKPHAPQSPSALGLPVSRRFQEGRFVFRGDWDDADAPLISMYVNEWHRSPWGMSSFLPGAFEIHRKGPQVINQGGVSGHDWGGSGRAGSANMLVFPDRTLSAATSNNDDEGGHRRTMAKMHGSIDFVQDSPSDELDQVRSRLSSGSDDVDYVYADVTRAYNSTRFNDAFNPARVSEVVRQLVYFRPAESANPAIVVVLDRATTTDTKFEKNWLFHTAGEPMVNGTAQNGQPARGGHSDGHTAYTGATRVTATNTVNGSNGRVWLSPLLPANPRIVKIGGPDSSGKSWTEASHEYEDPYGKRYPYNPPSADQQQYVGQYRIEIIPSTPALSDVFLNVIEVADASSSSPTSTALLAANGLAAARVGNRIAAFNRVTANVVTGSLTIDQAGRYRVLIADLAPNGEYEVTVGTSPSRQVASGAGTVYLDVTAAANTRIELKATGTIIAQPNRAAQANGPAPPGNVRTR